jgi:hypothetical protein
MALVLNDRVRETTSVVGTGAVTLLGYVTSYQAFSVIGDGNTCYYTISDQIGANWEVGIGTYTSSGNTLARTKVLSSSNADALVSFTTGTKDVFITYPAETAVSGGGGGTYPTTQPSLNLDFANTKQLDPRITFVRNSTAAYYDGQTTALAEQNLLLQSQTFATTWVTSNTTLGSLITAPDGTTTAYPLTASAINGTLLQTFTATANAYTFSIYIQRVTGTGNIDITVDGTTYATQTTTGTWTRFNITTTPSAGSKTAGIRLAVSGDVVNIWGAQLEQRSSVTAYTPTTTAAITNYIPQLMTAPAGVARFECDPITRNSLGLWIEESRVNLFTYSSDFVNGGWAQSLVTISAPTIIAPDGTLTGVKFIPTAVSTTHYAYRNVLSGIANSTKYTTSIYVKKGEYDTFTINLNNIYNTFVASNITFNLTTGVIDFASGSVTATYSMTPAGNGWYRCSVTDTTTSAVTSGSMRTYFYVTTNATYTGNGYSGIYIWGAQFEAGAFATSYIPTVASTVTRAADQASMTGTNFSSWYNQAQGSFFVAYNGGRDALQDGYGRVLSSGTTPASNSFISSNGSTNSISSYNGSVSTSLTVANADFWGVGGKAAMSYSTTSTIISGNGFSNTNNTLPTWSTKTVITLGIGGAQQINGHISKILYYPVALSSSNLVALTS